MSPAPFVRACASRAESGVFVHGIPSFYRKRAIFAGPVVLLAKEYATEPRTQFAPVAGHPHRFYPQKLVILVRAKSVVTVTVPRGERRLALAYNPRDWRIPYSRGYRLSDGERAVTFRACPADEPSFVRKRRVVGRWTEFNGAFVVARAHCATLVVRARHYRRVVRVSFGAGACS